MFVYNFQIVIILLYNNCIQSRPSLLKNTEFYDNSRFKIYKDLYCCVQDLWLVAGPWQVKGENFKVTVPIGHKSLLLNEYHN